MSLFFSAVQPDTITHPQSQDLRPLSPEPVFWVRFTVKPQALQRARPRLIANPLTRLLSILYGEPRAAHLPFTEKTLAAKRPCWQHGSTSTTTSPIRSVSGAG